jgi:hypothetical protein
LGFLVQLEFEPCAADEGYLLGFSRILWSEMRLFKELRGLKREKIFWIAPSAARRGEGEAKAFSQRSGAELVMCAT